MEFDICTDRGRDGDMELDTDRDTGTDKDIFKPEEVSRNTGVIRRSITKTPESQKPS